MTQSSSDGPVDLQTNRLRLRSLKPADASDRWRSWTKDPDVMGPLNAPVRDLSRQDLANYIAAYDNINRYLIGIFEKESGSQIGFFMIEVDRGHQTAVFNVVIGEKIWWGKDVVNEGRAALLDFFFEHRGIEKACGAPLARNFAALFSYKSQGWRHEGTMRGQRRSVVDGSRLDQYQFGLMRQEWIALRTGKGHK
jgi:RimJ/RimL family protein N-acetyltransferase